MKRREAAVVALFAPSSSGGCAARAQTVVGFFAGKSFDEVHVDKRITNTDRSAALTLLVIAALLVPPLLLAPSRPSGSVARPAEVPERAKVPVVHLEAEPDKEPAAESRVRESAAGSSKEPSAPPLLPPVHPKPDVRPVENPEPKTASKTKPRPKSQQPTPAPAEAPGSTVSKTDSGKPIMESGSGQMTALGATSGAGLGPVEVARNQESPIGPPEDATSSTNESGLGPGFNGGEIAPVVDDEPAPVVAPDDQPTMDRVELVLSGGGGPMTTELGKEDRPREQNLKTIARILNHCRQGGGYEVPCGAGTARVSCQHGQISIDCPGVNNFDQAYECLARRR